VQHNELLSVLKVSHLRAKR